MRPSILFVYCVLLTGSLFVSDSASAAKISSGHDPAADFSTYRTFAWRDGKPAEIAKAQGWIVSAVERELVARGLEKLDAGPDLYVMTFALVDKHTLDELADLTTWEFWTGVKSVRAADVGAGTLVVDLVDAHSEQIVWRGLATGAVSGNVEKNRKKIDKLVRKLFETLPGDRP